MKDDQMIGEVFQAAQSGDAVRLKELLDTNAALANTENSDGLTPLGYAAYFGQMEVVQVLLEKGAEVNAVSHSKVSFIPSNTALHAVIAGERNLEVIQVLLEQGADPTIFDSNGHTSLHTAAFHDDNTQIIKLLLEYGAKINARAEGGPTALAIAIKQGNLQVAVLLRQHGAIE